MRHRFHAICPYFAMFPEAFVEKHLAASRFQGIVFDPFCGRGTTVFEALLRGRSSAGCDLNPVAVCISGAKCAAPTRNEVEGRLDELEVCFEDLGPDDVAEELKDFFSLCYHEDTYRQVRFLRKELDWRNKRTDRFLAALCLGALHGESHRSPNYFSNRMPRTISTKPGYSVRWWTERGYVAPYRNVFEILRRMIRFRFRTEPPVCAAEIAETDVRAAARAFPMLHGRVSDMITSPPYLDTTNYREDQWLRLWFLGEQAGSAQRNQDGRHRSRENYWRFLEEAWRGVAPLLADEARLVVRIGGRKLAKDEIFERLVEALSRGLERVISPIDWGITSPIRRSQANSFRGGKASPTVEHDFCFMVK